MFISIICAVVYWKSLTSARSFCTFASFLKKKAESVCFTPKFYGAQIHINGCVQVHLENISYKSHTWRAAANMLTAVFSNTWSSITANRSSDWAVWTIHHHQPPAMRAKRRIFCLQEESQTLRVHFLRRLCLHCNDHLSRVRSRGLRDGC